MIRPRFQRKNMISTENGQFCEPGRNAYRFGYMDDKKRSFNAPTKFQAKNYGF